MPGRVLVVDDDRDLLHLIGVRLGAAGYEVEAVESGEQALAAFTAFRPQVVVTDLRMGGMDGMALFTRLQTEAPLVPVIVLTAHGTIPEAVAATQRGVFSFLTKPFESQDLLRRVADAVRLSPSLDPESEAAAWRRELLTADVRMEELLRQARRLADERQPILILGPLGSGKRTLAQAIHRAGRHADGPFVEVACTEHPARDLEEMFVADGGSIVRRAEGGTLHVRDIGALPPAAQLRLFTLAFAQVQARFPLQCVSPGSPTLQPPQLQLIASSPRPLDGALAENSFRSDLFYLLGGSTLQLSSLGERPNDIPLLARHFLKAICERCSLAPDALAALRDARWPGNVSQLKNVLSQAVALSNGKSISESTIRRLIRDSDEAALVAFDDARREFERDYLVRLLRATAGNVSQAARVAQRNRTEFYKLLARHGLDPICFKAKLK